VSPADGTAGRSRRRRPVISSVTGKPIEDWDPESQSWKDRPVFDGTTRDEQPEAADDESNTRRLLEDRPPHWAPKRDAED
jgi:hypothetical protein